MDIIGTHYKLNMYLLWAIGLWPYTNKKIRQIQIILVSSLLWGSVVSQRYLATSSLYWTVVALLICNSASYSRHPSQRLTSWMPTVVGTRNVFYKMNDPFKRVFWEIMLWFQLLTFVTVKYTVHLFLKNIPNIIVTMGYTLKYVTFRYQMETVKNLMEQIKYNWNSLNVEGELAIIEKHTRLGKFYTQMFALFVYPSALVIILMQFLPDFLNIAIPLNQSRPHQIIFTVEAVLDQQKYFYLIAAFLSIIVFTGATTFIATEGIFFAWLQHAASMFEIVSYRIKETVDQNPTKREFCKSESDVRTFANVMEVHKRALKCYQCIKHKFLPWYLILYLLGVVSLSCNLFRVSQLLESNEDIGELLMTGLLITSIFAYMYYLNYVMQQVSDSSDEIFKESYNAKWYETPVDTQKQLLFLMLCNVEGVNFNVYGLFDSSIQGFAKLVKVSFSYFMTLRSIG